MVPAHNIYYYIAESGTPECIKITNQYMDTISQSGQYAMDDTTYYLISIIAIVLLFIIQRYSYLIDRWLSRKNETKWQGKPWPLISGIVIGLLFYVFNLTTPGGLAWEFSKLNWQEYSLTLISIFTLLGIFIESMKNFNGIYRFIRLIIWTTLTIVYIVAGVYTGLLLSIALAIFIVIYFLFFWKKRLKIS